MASVQPDGYQYPTTGSYQTTAPGYSQPNQYGVTAPATAPVGYGAPQDPNYYKVAPDNQPPAGYQAGGGAYGGAYHGTEKTPLIPQDNAHRVDRTKSWMDGPSEVDWKAQTPDDVKRGFLRKVYGTLSLQLLLTVAICAACMLIKPLREWVISNVIVMYVWMILGFVFLIALHFKKNEYPINGQLLIGFTVCEAMMIGVLCAVYQQAGYGNLVAIAAGMTVAIFLSLTAFVMYSKIDFSWMSGFLFVGLMVMIMWGFVNLIFGFHATYLYSACGALLFCGFIVFDTDMIMTRMGCDDWVIAVIELYLDIVNLFLYILSFLSARD